jgi:hypothetical protein
MFAVPTAFYGAKSRNKPPAEEKRKSLLFFPPCGLGYNKKGKKKKKKTLGLKAGNAHG